MIPLRKYWLCLRSYLQAPHSGPADYETSPRKNVLVCQRTVAEQRLRVINFT